MLGARPQVGQCNRPGAHQRAVPRAPAGAFVQQPGGPPRRKRRGPVIEQGQDAPGLVADVLRGTAPVQPTRNDAAEDALVAQRVSPGDRLQDRQRHRGVVGPLSRLVTEHAGAERGLEVVGMGGPELVRRAQGIPGSRRNNRPDGAIQLDRRQLGGRHRTRPPIHGGRGRQARRDLDERRGQRNVGRRSREVGCNLSRGVAGLAAPDLGHQEGQPGMGCRERHEGGDFTGEDARPAHGVDGVRLALQSMAPAPHGPEGFVGDTGGTAAVPAAGIRTEHEDLVRFQPGDPACGDEASGRAGGQIAGHD